MTIMDSNNPFAYVYYKTDPGPSKASLAKEAIIEDKTFRYLESLEDGMRDFKLIDSKTSAARTADEAIAMVKAEIGRTADIMKARLHENTKL